MSSRCLLSTSLSVLFLGWVPSSEPQRHVQESHLHTMSSRRKENSQHSVKSRKSIRLDQFKSCAPLRPISMAGGCNVHVLGMQRTDWLILEVECADPLIPGRGEVASLRPAGCPADPGDLGRGKCMLGIKITSHDIW